MLLSLALPPSADTPCGSFLDDPGDVLPEGAPPLVKRLRVLADEGRERDPVRELVELLEQSF
jgi:hypothetical protein